MSSQQLEPDAGKATTGQPPVGLVLAQAREAAEVTQRDIAEALKLPVATILALEADDRSQLPAAVFTRGYIRAYAKLLEIDPEPLVASMVPDVESDADSGRLPERSVFLLPRPGAAASLLTHQLTQPKFLLGAVVVIGFLIFLGVLMFGGDSDSSSPSNVSNPAIESAQDKHAVSDAPGVGTLESGQKNEAVVHAVFDDQPEVVEVAPDDNAEVSNPKDVQVESPGQISVDSVASSVTAEFGGIQADGTPRRLTPTGGDRLSFEFSEECWVDIKGTDGATLYANLGSPGGQMEFVGAAPFRVLLGYAPGVSLKYNAELVALAPHTRNNVASLVIGQ